MRDDQLTLPTAADVDAAASALAGVIETTSLQRNDRLSQRTGAEVWLKREDLQPVRSYKIRGAYNLIAGLTDAEKQAGVIAASAGNHGQGVAYACAALGIHGRVFIPTTTPRQKRDRMNALGGEFIELVSVGDTYDEAAAAALAEAATTHATLVPAFDDPRTIAGQGTLAAELVSQLGKAPDVVVIPVGGGGMLSGCITWFAEHHPETRVIGVEPEGAPCMATAVRAGGPIDLEHIDTFVDGAAVARAGDLTHRIVADSGIRLTTAPEGQICREMLDLYQVEGIIAEPAGALAASTLGRQVEAFPGQTVVAIVSGGNNDVSRYAEVVERSLLWEGLKHYFLVNFPQEPGALRRFLDEVLGPDDDVVLFEYVKRSNRDTGPALVGIELSDARDLHSLLQRIEKSPMEVTRVEPGSQSYRYLV
ncbi:threonine ammonia-lyase IlvA [Mariniluteicoccus endophyticus]